MASSDSKKSKPQSSRATSRKPGVELVPVVGVGASAGGLEAFRQLLSRLPASTGMALVVVQHLAPRHDSMLTELLARSTTIPVDEVKDGMKVAPDHIYVIPPNCDMVISKGVLHLLPRRETELHHMPIDRFLTSLAKDRKDQAIGVILSGTASDGTLGLKAIKAEGGITFAQDEQTAKYDSMPHSAIAAGCVDFVLPPEGIAMELARIGRHPYLIQALAAQAEEGTPVAGEDELHQILTLVRGATGDDFTWYKKSSIKRRIKRRMVLQKMDELAPYLRYLRGNNQEIQALYQDFLINVTGFFRDPGVYRILKKKVLPALVKGRPTDTALRIWVPGCSTGEEVYSIAISALEFLGAAKSNVPIQLFGTDISEAAIEKARAGNYPETISADVSPERLRRFFVSASRGYRISKTVRDMCIFARHNILQDPPFSRMDLISCRNLLIYLEVSTHKKTIPAFSYALRLPGFLILGPSESLTGYSELFRSVDKKFKVYAKNPVSLARAGRYWLSNVAWGKTQPAEQSGKAKSDFSVQKEVERLLLTDYAPAGVVVAADLSIVQFIGQVGGFLEPAPGQASLNLAKLTQGALSLDVRSLIHTAMKRHAPAIRAGVRIKEEGRYRTVTLEVVPIKGAAEREPYFLVLLREEAPPSGKAAVPEGRAAKRKSEAADAGRLYRELEYTRAHVQSIMEEQEATNAELRSANEEIQSANEELQSTNEELETAKEELQSSNEELTTLNEEMQNRNTELSTLLNDLNNLVNSINVPVVILSKDLRVRRYTPLAERVLNLIPTDIGRPITDLKHNVEIPNFESLIAETVTRGNVKELEAQDRNGHWYQVRIRPYRTLENFIDGAVLTLMDIDALKTEMKELHLYAESIVETVRQPLIVLDDHLRVLTANAAFYETFGVSEEETKGRFVHSLGEGQWNIAALREVLERILPAQTAFEGFEVKHKFPGIGERTMLLNGRQIRTRLGAAPLILLSIEDVTENKKAEAALRALPVQLVESQEEERRRIARELHDSTGQTMAALSLNLSVLDGKADRLDEHGRAALSDSLDLASEVAVELRNISYVLHPPALDEMGLDGALRWYVDNFVKRTGLEVELHLPSRMPALQEPARLTAFRLVQEALTNAHRHSGSKTVKVVVAHGDSELILEIADEGSGIPPDHVGGLGLLSMRERVAQLGGRLEIKSGDGGTSIKAILPITTESATP